MVGPKAKLPAAKVPLGSAPGRGRSRRNAGRIRARGTDALLSWLLERSREYGPATLSDMLCEICLGLAARAADASAERRSLTEALDRLQADGEIERQQIEESELNERRNAALRDFRVHRDGHAPHAEGLCCSQSGRGCCVPTIDLAFSLSSYDTTGLSIGQWVFGLTDWYRDGTLTEYVAVEGPQPRAAAGRR